MTVAELTERMDFREYLEWQAFYRIAHEEARDEGSAARAQALADKGRKG